MSSRKKITGNFKLLVVILVVIILLLIYFAIVIYNYINIKKYESTVLPNSYLQSYKIDNFLFDELDNRIDYLSDSILNNKIIISCNGKEYDYLLKDLGLSLDVEQIINDIANIQDTMKYSNKISLLYNNTIQIYQYKFKYDENSLISFLNNFNNLVNINLQNGYFSNDGGAVKYNTGIDSFTLNIDKSLDILKTKINNGVYDKIELVGDSLKAETNELYKTIDTKVSSFSTNFNPYISRATNLNTALNYINGAIIEPGEVFSFYDYAGPYNKSGYVFYYEFVGNGVCQIATTVYNAALLGGLEIVKRYPHAAKSVYVEGGLDATVASYSSGWNVDFQFKNTYSYPIYIMAYSNEGVAYVEFWSNSNATEGKTYSTESVQIGYRGYTTYLHTYKDGIEVSKDLIDTTWYTED